MKALIAVLLWSVSICNAASVTVDDSSCARYGTVTQPGNNVYITCIEAQSPAPPGTPYCSLTASATTITAGQAVNLNTGCSPIPTSYKWTGAGVEGFTGAATSLSPTATTTYTVTGVNQYGDGNTASVTVTVNQPAPPPVTDLCASQGLSNVTIPMDWGGGNLKEFQVSQNQVVSFVLNVGADPMGGSLLTTYGSSEKLMSISTKKCDFAETLPTRCLNGASDPGLWYTNGTSRYACQLTPNTTYYVNVRNAVLVNNTTPVRPIVDSCTQGTCTFWLRY